MCALGVCGPRVPILRLPDFSAQELHHASVLQHLTLDLTDVIYFTFHPQKSWMQPARHQQLAHVHTLRTEMLNETSGATAPQQRW